METPNSKSLRALAAHARQLAPTLDDISRNILERYAARLDERAAALDRDGTELPAVALEPGTISPTAVPAAIAAFKVEVEPAAKAGDPAEATPQANREER